MRSGTAWVAPAGKKKGLKAGWLAVLMDYHQGKP